MIVKKNISEYLLHHELSIHEALKKSNESKVGVLFVVDEQSILLGSFTDGDFRRWVIEQEKIDLSTHLTDVMNESFFSMHINTVHSDVSEGFSEKISCIPLVDDKNRVVAIALPKQTEYSVNNTVISQHSRAFIIAEIGNNHQGDISIAKKLVDSAVDAGVDCVKFQMRDIDQLYRDITDSNTSEDLGSEYTLDLLSKFQLSDDEFIEVFDYCAEKRITAICTPWDISSFKKLEEYGMPAYKIASADLTNLELLSEVAKSGKLIICSTGMSQETEIVSAIDYLNKVGAQYIFLHCNSTYPTPYKDVNLNYLSKLKKNTGSIVGYSGHERGTVVPIVAVALGAKVIEKHLTLDKEQEGNDHKVSLLPNEMKEMVENIRIVEESLGVSSSRIITQGEMINRHTLSKSIVFNQSVQKGQLISRSMLDIKSPGVGVQPNRIDEIVDTYARKEYFSGDIVFESDIDGGNVKKSKYEFNRPYGIPVRFHDYRKLTSDLMLDFVEFHLSYKDLEFDIGKAYSKNNPEDIGFAVHAPELFSGDHILDLCSADIEYRKRSISELDKVISLTKSLESYFTNADNPVVVVNVGGWSTAGFLNEREKKIRYHNLMLSLDEIDTSAVTLSIQTMPPFPWHFGGQSYHNLFVDPYEIAQFCRQNSVKICLDISHSMMACNYYGWDLYEFIKTVGPHVSHLHVVDALGVDGEGVQIGHGDIDFNNLKNCFDLYLPGIQFIPEVWQGHQDNGHGFWHALEFLERKNY